MNNISTEKHASQDEHYKIGYARISTREQNLEMQKEELKKAGCQKIYEDVISGSTLNRPGLTNLIQSLRPHDIVVVWRMDRLARRLLNLITILQRFADCGASAKSLTEPTLNTDGPQGKLVLHILDAVAEYELSLFRERSEAGREKARERGTTLGRRPKISQKDCQEIYDAVSTGFKRRTELARLFRVCPSTITNIINRIDREKRQEK